MCFVYRVYESMVNKQKCHKSTYKYSENLLRKMPPFPWKRGVTFIRRCQVRTDQLSSSSVNHSTPQCFLIFWHISTASSSFTQKFMAFSKTLLLRIPLNNYKHLIKATHTQMPPSSGPLLTKTLNRFVSVSKQDYWVIATHGLKIIHCVDPRVACVSRMKKRDNSNVPKSKLTKSKAIFSHWFLPLCALW